MPFLTPNPVIAGLRPYRVPRARAHFDLHLDGNEGLAPDPALLTRLAGADPEIIRRYPKPGDLEAALAERCGVAPEQVVATCGADDALDRACRAALAPGRQLVLPAPTFEMVGRYARLVGAEVIQVPWPGGPYPLDAVLAATGPDTGAVAVVSPNNPTGAVASAADLEALGAAVPHAVILVDLAYGEFADEDLTGVALRLPNAIVFRTLSKAWGLAGLRVGYALGPAPLIDWLRVTGNPYAVTGLSALLASWRLAEGQSAVDAFVGRVRHERRALGDLLARLGAEPYPSQANFVLVRVADAVALRDGLAAHGIAVRAWPGRADLRGLVRITCPGDSGDFDRLARTLEEVMTP